ncbi:hypothetical protein [Endozoicomonas sp. 2B-B]
MDNPVATIVHHMKDRPGSTYVGVDTDVLTAIVEQEWQLGNWVMLTGKNPDDFWGWLSYYPMDKVSLAVVRKFGLEECIKRRFPIRPGKHVYLCNCVIAQDASPMTYRRLYSLAVMRNSQAKTINAHLISRRGIRWFTREGLNHGI